ncbi:MAG: glycosyltransferase N-terminal domain-containing protein [Pseudomonadota bacterium]
MRWSERFGRSRQPRPEGRIIWINAVSVGETRLALMIARDLLAHSPQIKIVLTTTTATATSVVTSAGIDNLHHAYAPLDLATPVRSFLAHWRPDLAIFVESELWPRQIIAAHGAGTRLMLVNARLSDSSQRAWARAPGLAAALLSRFSKIVAQSDEMAQAVCTLGADPATVETIGDLKALADPLPDDQEHRESLARELADRPLWLATSTHPGEEELCASAHNHLPDEALLIIIPRHPERGPSIAAALRKNFGSVSLQSTGQTPSGRIHVADELGKLGLWYRLASVALIGGSLAERSGHNPYEAAALGCFAISGRGIKSFETAYFDLRDHGQAEILLSHDPAAIAAAISGRMAPARRGSGEGGDEATRRAKRKALANSLLALVKS